MKTVWTIGHSTHTIEMFIRLLDKHEIDIVIDIRSCPYSEYTPQFNKEVFKQSIEDSKRSYVYKGNYLGGDVVAPFLSVGKKVDFKKLLSTTDFSCGILTVEDLVACGYRGALVCSEKNYKQCHRSYAVGKYLEQLGYEIIHITPGVFDD